MAVGLAWGMVDSVGFAVHAHECGDYKTPVFRENIAHSINGYGASIFKNRSSLSQSTCMEASYFTAYKCAFAGIVSYDSTNKIIFSRMVLLDNAYSAAPLIG